MEQIPSETLIIHTQNTHYHDMIRIYYTVSMRFSIYEKLHKVIQV